MSRRTKRKAGSTAHDIAHVRAVHNGVLFIAPTTTAGQTQACMRGVAVIEVEGSTFTLRSEEDRASLVLGYQALLKAIPPGRSVQFLIRRRPHDLSAYIQKLDTLATEHRVPPIYRQLASGHADHLEQISGTRSLYRSCCYLVVSAADHHQRSFALPFLSGKRRQANQQRRKQAVQGDLDIQCERYLAALANLGLSAHRLRDGELAQLAATCLVPARDDQRGLPDPALLAIDRPVSSAIETLATSPLMAPRAIETAAGSPYRQVMDALPNEYLMPGARADEQRPGRGSRTKNTFEDGNGLPLAGWTQLADLLAPSAIEERPNHLLVEGEYVRSLAVVGEEMGAEEQYTLLDVVPLLQKPGFRRMVLEDVRDTVVLDWFKNYYDPLRQSFRDEMISSIINKISKYAAAKVSRRLLGQSRATIRLSDDIRSGRAILVNTASGIVGEEVSALVGATLVGLFQAALAEQIRLPADVRRRFWVVIDEFQTYLGIDYNTMLAELRKYGGSFALATQSLSYLDEVDRSLKPTVLANSDHLFCFTMEAADARTLAPYLDGLEAADLVNLDAYTCYARWTVQGQRLPTFSLKIASPPSCNEQMAASIRLRSNERHTRPATLVDEEVSPEPLQPLPALDDAASWPDDHESEEPEGTVMAAGDEKGSGEPARKRGGRGKGSTGKGTVRDHKGQAPLSSQTDGEPLSLPYVLNESARLRPRSRVWQPEDSESSESGEMRGE